MNQQSCRLTYNGKWDWMPAPEDRMWTIQDHWIGPDGVDYYKSSKSIVGLVGIGLIPEDPSNEVLRLHHWLISNEETLSKYSTMEKAQMAITCGFTLEASCKAVSDRVSMINRLITAWEPSLTKKKEELHATRAA